MLTTIKHKLATFVLVTALGLFCGLGVLTALIGVVYAIMPSGDLFMSTAATFFMATTSIGSFKLAGAIAEALIDG